MLSDMTAIFENANNLFLERETRVILRGLSERHLCGSLMGYLKEVLVNTDYKMYYVDTEYNRNGDELKTIWEMPKDSAPKPVKITCDLIVHSRGEIEKDNLIAIEMKKSTNSLEEKAKDKTRLECLTKESFDNVLPPDGNILPEPVYGYVLGVYYELNIKKRQIDIMYFVNSKMSKSYSLGF